MLYVLGNPQKRDISVRISSMQFLRDRELGIHSKKHGSYQRVSGLYSCDRKYTHDYETNITRTMNMKSDIDGIEMSI